MKRKPVQNQPSLPERWEASLPWIVALMLALAPLLLGRLSPIPALAACCLLSLLVLVDILLVGKKPQDLGRPAFLVMGCFLLLNWLSLLASVDFTVSLAAVLQLTAGVLAVWLVLRAAPQPLTWPLALSGLVSGASLTALWGLKEYVFTLQSGTFTSWRTFSTFDNPNLLAGFLAVSLLLTCALGLNALRQKAWLKIALLGLTALMQLAILATTASRGGTLALLAGLVAFSFALTWGKPAAKRLALGYLIAIVLLSSLILVPPMKAKVSAAFSGRASSTIFRAYTWAGTARTIAARPLLGFGPGTFPIAFAQYKLAAYTRMAHQDYLQFAAQAGLPAGLAFLIFLVLAIRASFPKTDDENPRRVLQAGVFAALVALAAHALVDYDLQVLCGFLICCALASLALGPSSGAVSGNMKTLSRIVLGAGLLALLGVSYMQLVVEQELQLGLLSIAKGNNLEAEVHYARAARASFHNAEAELGLGEALVGQSVASGSESTFNRAEGPFQKAAQYSPQNPKYAFRQARYFLMKRDAERALEALTRTLELDPHYIKAYLVKAQVLRQLGRESEATALWQQVLALEQTAFGAVRPLEFGKETGYASAAYFLGRQALAAGNLAEARSLLARGQSVVAENRAMPAHILESLEFAGNWTEADSRQLTAIEGLLALLEADLLQAEGKQGQAVLKRKKGEELLASLGLNPEEAERLL